MLLAALGALLLHDALGLRVLPPRGSAAWTALVAALVALPFARALPTTARRRPAWQGAGARPGRTRAGCVCVRAHA